MNVTPTPSCGDGNSDEGFGSFMSHDAVAVVLIALFCATIVFCCLSLILCFIVCTLCHRRHRTSDLQDLPKSNGYVMPVVSEEKESLEIEDHSTDTFRTESFKSNVQQAITQEDVQNDIKIHHEKKLRKDSELAPLFEKDVVVQESEVDIDNPLYIRHDSSSNDNSMDRREATSLSSMPTTPHAKCLASDIMDDNDYENNSEFDYENIGSVRLAKMIAKQGVSLTGTIPTLPTSPKSKQIPPETKPKPKNRQRTQSERSDRVNAESDEEDPHYMTPRKTSQIPWNTYKELDFSTVEPSADYTVPTREYTTS